MGYDSERGFLGSVYTSVAKQLLRSKRWRRRRGTTVTPIVDLVFGEALAHGVNYQQIASLGRGRPILVNYFPPSVFRSICRKVACVTTLRDYARRHGLHVHAIAPPSYCFYPARPALHEYAELEEAHAWFAARGEHVWIVKPSDGGKGKKILVMDSLDDILDHVEALPPGSVPWVVQKYVERPLLLPGRRKFDVRCWVAITHDERILLYRQGVLRTGSVPFSLDNLGDDYVHLSNHCIQATHPGYGRYEPTNEMFYAEFDAFIRRLRLRTSEGEPATLDTVVLPQIRWLVYHCCRAMGERLPSGSPVDLGYGCFQLLGFDFMIDDGLHVHFIEANSSPAVAAQLLPQFTDDFVHRVINPVFQVDAPGLEAAPGSRSLAALGKGGKHALARAVHPQRGSDGAHPTAPRMQSPFYVQVEAAGDEDLPLRRGRGAGPAPSRRAPPAPGTGNPARYAESKLDCPERRRLGSASDIPSAELAADGEGSAAASASPARAATERLLVEARRMWIDRYDERACGPSALPHDWEVKARADRWDLRVMVRKSFEVLGPIR